MLKEIHSFYGILLSVSLPVNRSLFTACSILPTNYEYAHCTHSNPKATDLICSLLIFLSCLIFQFSRKFIPHIKM